MTQQPTFDEIQKQHQELLRQLSEIDDVDLDAPQMKAFLEGVRGFLKTLAQAGTFTENTEQRSLLRDFIRYWSSIINDKTGNLPIVQLQPFNLSLSPRRSHGNFFRRPSLLFAVFILIVISFIIIFILFKSSIIHPPSTPTPSPKATGLTLQKVQAWCIPSSSGTCNLSRFEQLVESNRYVNPNGVHMKLGGPVSFNVPAGISVDFWDCSKASSGVSVSGPIKLPRVCKASFRITSKGST